MNHMAYVTAAYAVMLAGSAGLALLSWRAMRRAETAADAMRERP